MIDAHAKRQMAENEVVFREYNERIQKGFDELARLAREEGRSDLVFEDDLPLQFYCECSDENCRERLLLKPSEYAQIHDKRTRFIVVKGHQTDAIEQVIAETSGYAVVQKTVDVPNAATKLNATSVDNV
jgi:hypothetical protein